MRWKSTAHRLGKQQHNKQASRERVSKFMYIIGKKLERNATRLCSYKLHILCYFVALENAPNGQFTDYHSFLCVGCDACADGSFKRARCFNEC